MTPSNLQHFWSGRLQPSAHSLTVGCIHLAVTVLGFTTGSFFSSRPSVDILKMCCYWKYIMLEVEYWQQPMCCYWKYVMLEEEYWQQLMRCYWKYVMLEVEYWQQLMCCYWKYVMLEVDYWQQPMCCYWKYVMLEEYWQQPIKPMTSLILEHHKTFQCNSCTLKIGLVYSIVRNNTTERQLVRTKLCRHLRRLPSSGGKSLSYCNESR